MIFSAPRFNLPSRRCLLWRCQLFLPSTLWWDLHSPAAIIVPLSSRTSLPPSIPSPRPRPRLIADGNNSSDEGQTTDGEADSDRESIGGGAWWGGLDDNGDGDVHVEVEVAGAGVATAEEVEASKRRIARTEKLRRSMSSSPMKLRVRADRMGEMWSWICGSSVNLRSFFFGRGEC